MAFNYMENISYKNNKPNFERDTVKNIAALLAVDPANKEYDYGHIVFCEEDGRHYRYNYDYTNPPADTQKSAATGWFTLLEATPEDDSVTATKIKDGSVTATKILSNVINNNHLTPESVTASKIKDGSITAEKLAASIKENIANNGADISSEITRATAAEDEITVRLSAEVTRATAAEEAIRTLIDTNAEGVQNVQKLIGWVEDAAATDNAAIITQLTLDVATNKTDIDKIRTDVPYAQKMAEYGCNKLIFINELKDFAEITNGEANTYYVVTSDIYITSGLINTHFGDSVSDNNYEVKIKDNCVIDFGEHKIDFNNTGVGFVFASPYVGEVDGDNFEKYPRILYNRNGHRGLFNRAQFGIHPLSGMWRVNDDTVFVWDFLHKRDADSDCVTLNANVFFSSFCNCRIVFEPVTDTFLYYNTGEEDYTLGINSNVTITGDVIAEKFEKVYTDKDGDGVTETLSYIKHFILNFNILGSNVTMENLKVRYNYPEDDVFTKSKYHRIKVYLCGGREQNFTFKGNSGLFYINRKDDYKYLHTVRIEDNSFIEYEGNNDWLTAIKGVYKNSLFRNNKISHYHYGMMLNGRNNVIEGNELRNILYISIWLPANAAYSASYYVDESSGESSSGAYYGNENVVVRDNAIYYNNEEAISTDGANSSVNICDAVEVITTNLSSSSTRVWYKNKIRARFGFEDSILSGGAEGVNRIPLYKNGCYVVALHKDRGLTYGKILNVTQDETDVANGTYTIECPYNTFNNCEVGDRYMIVPATSGLLVERNYIAESTNAIVLFGATMDSTFRNNTVVTNRLVNAGTYAYASSPIYGRAFATNLDKDYYFRSYGIPCINNRFLYNTIIDDPSAYLARISFSTINDSGSSDLFGGKKISQLTSAEKIDVEAVLKYDDAADCLFKDIIFEGNIFKNAVEFVNVDGVIARGNGVNILYTRSCKNVIDDNRTSPYNTDDMGASTSLHRLSIINNRLISPSDMSIPTYGVATYNPETGEFENYETAKQDYMRHYDKSGGEKVRFVVYRSSFLKNGAVAYKVDVSVTDALKNKLNVEYDTDADGNVYYDFEMPDGDCFIVTNKYAI